MSKVETKTMNLYKFLQISISFYRTCFSIRSSCTIVYLDFGFILKFELCHLNLKIINNSIINNL